MELNGNRSADIARSPSSGRSKGFIIYPNIHTPTAVSTPQGDSQRVSSSQGEASRSGTPPHSARRSRGSN